MEDLVKSLPQVSERSHKDTNPRQVTEVIPGELILEAIFQPLGMTRGFYKT